VVASLGISIPDTRLSESRLVKLRRLVVKSAAEIAAAFKPLTSFAPGPRRAETRARPRKLLAR
jgi:hypothetical protein